MKEEEENLDLEQINNANENEDEDDENEENIISKIEKLNDFDKNHNYLFRFCLLGNAGVGKTSLLTRFCDDAFKENYNNTIGVDFRVVTLKYKDIISKIHIWDTAGQERFRSLALNYINNSHGFAFIYDVTDQQTFDDINTWISLALDKNKKSVFNFLIGNKCDNEKQRQVSKEQGEKLAKQNNFYFMETSAKNDENVKKLFNYFTYKLIKYYKENKYEESENIELSPSKGEELATLRPSQSNCAC